MPNHWLHGGYALVLWLLLSGCQSTPPPPLEEALTPAIDTIAFDPEELVITAEGDENALGYLQPKIIQSPLAIKNNIWDRVRKGFELDYNYDDSRIDAQMPWFINNQAYLDRVNTRGSRYLWHIVEEIEKRDMPLEIALLPIVESAFDPFAYSHARASGVWQFIASTARFMGLRLDWWYDGRRDILASTDASLELLQLLHDNLNDDWLLALAAYNSGEGNVRRAIKKNIRKGKPTDFWHLDLPRETRAYVPKLLALARLYNEPEKYNIYILPIPNESYFDVVETGSQIDLAQAARLSNVPMEELYLLNPAFNRWATSPIGPHHLLVPRENAESFRVALAGFPIEKRITWEHYTVKSGDTLSSIASDFNTTSYDMMRTNKLKNNVIRVGSTLMIPVASSQDYSMSAEARAAKQQSNIRARSDNTSDSEKLVHIVKRGDTLSALGKRYGLSSKKLAESNGMALRDPLRIGQKLNIWTKSYMIAPSPIPPVSPSESPELPELPVSETPATEAPVTEAPTEVPVETPAESPAIESIELPDAAAMVQEKMQQKIIYRVRSGDNLGKIARKFHISIPQIVEWNKIDPDKYLRTGQKLTLHVDVANTY